MNLNEFIKLTKTDKATAYFVARKYLFLNKYIKQTSKIKRSLDIGSNYGLFTELLQSKGYSSYGIEPNNKLLSFARNHGVSKYSLGSAEKISFPDNHFDVILLLDTLEHIINRDKALNEINRVLKPNGIVIITVPNTLSYFYLRSFMTSFLRGQKPWKNVHYQQNYFHWEHQINNFLKIIGSSPILAVPLFEPKLIRKHRLARFEYSKPRLSCISADPVIICTKRTEPLKGDTDITNLK